jgi:hypothetical protein
VALAHGPTRRRGIGNFPEIITRLASITDRFAATGSAGSARAG